jgi:hypothetical protein
MAAGDIARGALHLIRWGKDIIPATADEIKRLGPNAARVKAVLDMSRWGVSDDAWKVAEAAWRPHLRVLDRARGTARINTIFDLNEQKRLEQLKRAEALGHDLGANWGDGYHTGAPSAAAAVSESVSDLIVPETYRTLTNPLAAARRFDKTVPNAPEGFTAVVRNLGERGFITGPKSIEAARRLSMESPTFTDLVISFVQDGMTFQEAMAAARALGL